MNKIFQISCLLAVVLMAQALVGDEAIKTTSEHEIVSKETEPMTRSAIKEEEESSAARNKRFIPLRAGLGLGFAGPLALRRLAIASALATPIIAAPLVVPPIVPVGKRDVDEITKKEVAVEELKAEQIATKDATEINKKKDTIAAEEEEIKDKRFVVVRPVVVRPIGRDVSEVEEKKDTEIVKPIVEREEEIIKKDTTIDAEINKKEAEHHINDESKRFVVVRPVVRPVVVRPVVVRPIGRDVSEVEEEKEKKETVVDKKNVEQVKEDIVESTTLLPVATTTDEIIKPALIESLDTIVADKKPVLEHEHELIKKEIIKRGALDNGHVF